MGRNISSWFEGIILAGVVAIVGFFAFPGLNNYLQTVSTTGWNNIAVVAFTALPYVAIGVIGLIIFLLIKGAR